jgi:hypothetical protein
MFPQALSLSVLSGKANEKNHPDPVQNRQGRPLGRPYLEITTMNPLVVCYLLSAVSYQR